MISWVLMLFGFCVVAFIMLKLSRPQLMIWIGIAAAMNITYQLGKRTSAGESIYGSITLAVISMGVGVLARIILGIVLGRRLKVPRL